MSEISVIEELIQRVKKVREDKPALTKDPGPVSDAVERHYERLRNSQHKGSASDQVKETES